MVWDIVKHLYDKYKINDSLLFQLFGIFNRFCDPREIPLTLSNKAAVFLFQKLDIPPSIATCQETWDFTQLLIAIQSCIGPSMESKIQRLHTKIVKNLLMEGKIRVKIAQENGNFIHWASSLTSTPLPPKLIQINHRHLIVYKNESEIMYKIPLFEAVARVKKSNNLIFKKSACTVVILAKEVVAGSNRSTTIELSFDPFKDEYEMYKWIEAVSQAADFTRQGSDPLTLIYQSHDIRPSYFKYGGHVSKAFSQVDPLAKSTLDMRDVAQHQPPVKRRSSAPNLEAAANEDSFSDSGVSSGSNA